MHPESEKRAAQLAVSRYGAAAAQVQKLYQVVVQAHSAGRTIDFLDALVQQKLITDSQAQELRGGLDTTHFDTGTSTGAVAPASKNGKSSSLPKPTADLAGPELRQLGEYRILRRLGEGGMGSVFLGYQEGSQQHVAIKVLPEHLAANQAAVDRFYREAKSGALLNHPNIVRILAVGKDQTEGCHYLVMEYVDGPSALGLLGRKGRLPVGDAVHIVLDIARALEHAHSRNIVHRDIKPDNILITQSGLAKLTDLGLAKRTDEMSHLTAARQGFGTPYYMPYEQAVNAKYADGRSDIYALGATLYHLVAGEVPFQGTNHLEVVEMKNIGEYPPASSYNLGVPPLLDEILDKMLARDPGDRYQTASELIVDLERSALAASVPSFIDADRALQDPVVRQRLAVQSQATAQDLQLGPRQPRSNARKANADVWYLRYRDNAGRMCKAKVTTEQVLKRLSEGRFSGTGEVEASHHLNRKFKPLQSYAVFANAMVGNQASAQGTADKPRGIQVSKLVSASRMWVLGSLGVAVAIVAAVLTRVLFWD